MTKKDLATLQEMLTRMEDRLNTRWDERLKVELGDTKREMRDEMHALLRASENRMTDRLTGEISSLRTEMREVEKRVISGVNNLIGENILPQIDELHRDMVLVKKHLHLV